MIVYLSALWSANETISCLTCCYGRPLHQAWLLSDLHTIPNNCFMKNSPQLSGYGIGFWCTRSLVQILPGPYISAMHLFICLFVTDFVVCYGRPLPQTSLFPDLYTIPNNCVRENSLK